MTKKAWKALYKQYGPTALASVFGVPVPTVRRWNSVGLPASRARLAESLETIKRHEGYEEKALREMMKLAKEEGKLPRVAKYSKIRDAQKTTGYEVSIPSKAMLNDTSLLQLQSRLAKEKLVKGKPNFIASVTVSAFVDESEKAGSGDVRFQVDHPDASSFIVESIVSSGLQTSKREAIKALTQKLKSKLSDREARFFLHGAYMSAYEYKTEREQLDFDNAKRKARRKRAKK